MRKLLLELVFLAAAWGFVFAQAMTGSPQAVTKHDRPIAAGCEPSAGCCTICLERACGDGCIGHGETCTLPDGCACDVRTICD